MPSDYLLMHFAERDTLQNYSEGVLKFMKYR